MKPAAWSPSPVSRRQASAMLLTAMAWPQAPVGAQPAPAPGRIADFEWYDTARARAVPARLYWPVEAPTAPAAVPLVVFSHGIGGSRQGYSYLGRRWSANGVACLHVQHAGSDATLWRGNPFSVVSRLHAAARESEAMHRAADLRFALDRLLGDVPAGAAVDRRRIVAAGHSYGANTALLAVGAQVVRDGRPIDLRDDRFGAAVVISAPPFYGERDLPAVLGRIAVPTLHVTATDDVIQIPGYHSAAADRQAIFDAVAHPHKLIAVYRGGSHSMFTDRMRTGGARLNVQVKQATAELGLAFFDAVFERRFDGLQRWQDAWQSILARAPLPVDAAPRLTGVSRAAVPVG